MSSFDRLTGALVALVAHLTARFDYHALYPATVVAQNADGTLELKPDDPRFGPGVSHVRVLLGLPGTRATVKPSSRVLLGFQAGDPKAPMATLWDTSLLDTLTLTAASGVTITTPGSVAMSASGTGTIHLACSTPGGIVLGDGSGNEAPIARVGDLVTMTCLPIPLSGNMIVNAPSGPALAAFVPPPNLPNATLLGTFVGVITGGSTVAFAD